jgi:hypothetical protein
MFFDFESVDLREKLESSFTGTTTGSGSGLNSLL